MIGGVGIGDEFSETSPAPKCPLRFDGVCIAFDWLYQRRSDSGKYAPHDSVGSLTVSHALLS